MGFKKTVLIFCLLITMPAFSQNIDSLKTLELKEIYHNLEYNTLAFNDLKETWEITDPLLLVKLFNRFIVNNAVTVNNHDISKIELSHKLGEIYSGNVVAKVRRRFYDNEIEYFAFLKKTKSPGDDPDYLIDPITDGFYLRKILGNELYYKIKRRDYFFINLTKDLYASKTGYYYDIYLDVFNPHLMFWSTTSHMSNKYTVTFFGKWGQEYIFLPGWYFNDYIFGMRVTYYDKLPKYYDEYNFKVSLGTSAKAGLPPFQSLLAESPLKTTGYSVYAQLSGQPFKGVIRNWNDFYLDLEAQFTFKTLSASSYGLPIGSKFNSVRDYVVAMVEQKKLLNIFDIGQLTLGAGVSSYDLYKYQILPFQEEVEVKELGHKSFLDKFEHFGIGKIGIENDGDLLQYSLSLLWGYDPDYNYSYFGIDSKFMLSNTFGFEVKAMISPNVNIERLPYRTKGYVTFSPIIRINY